MNNMKIKIILLFCLLLSGFSLKAEWKIAGAAVAGDEAVLSQNPANADEFVYAGNFTGSEFKITDGITVFVPLCGDNDPLEQCITLTAQSSPDDKGLRLRYPQQGEIFKLSLSLAGGTKTVIVERKTPPKELFVIGGPFNTTNGGWQLDDAKQLRQDTQDPFVFYYRGYIGYNTKGDERGSIKFLIGRSWDNNYHPLEPADIPLANAQQMRLGGADSKWTIPADGSRNGYYEIKLNTLYETIEVTYFDQNFPYEIYITGEAIPCGWTDSSPEVMLQTAQSVYQWTGAVTTGEFKFLKDKNTWGSCYVATSENEQIVLGQAHSIVYEFESWNNGGHDYKFVMPQAGQYTVTVDLNTMKTTVYQQSTQVISQFAPLSMQVFSGNNKIVIQSENALKSVKMFLITGLQLPVAVAGNQIDTAALPGGIYLLSLVDILGNRQNFKVVI